MNVAEKSMGLALGGLRRLARLEVIDRLGVRPQMERAVHAAVRGGFGTATAAARRFGSGSGSRSEPARQSTAQRTLFDLTPSEEQEMLRAAFRDVASQVLRPAAPAADADAQPPAEVLATTRDLGVLQLGIPTDLGGVVDERSSVTAALAAEALAHGDMGLAVAALAPAAVSTALALWGDAEQQAAYLTEFVSDAPPAAGLCVAEPTPAFDPMELATSAVRTSDGFRLQGEKSFVPLASDAELFVVAAQLDGRPALFVVESSTAGLSVELAPTMGVRASAAGRLRLDQVNVPRGALLADGAPDVYREMLARTRIAWSALAVGTSQAVLDYVIPYVNEREAFGAPISHRQAVAFAVADIAVELEGMRLLTWRAAGLADAGRPFARAAAHAHRLCADKGMDIGSHGVQLLGGHGYVKEHPVERWYRDLRAVGALTGGVLV